MYEKYIRNFSYMIEKKTVDKFKLQIFRINIKINNGDRGMGLKIIHNEGNRNETTIKSGFRATTSYILLGCIHLTYKGWT